MGLTQQGHRGKIAIRRGQVAIPFRLYPSLQALKDFPETMPLLSGRRAAEHERLHPLEADSKRACLSEITESWTAPVTAILADITECHAIIARRYSTKVFGRLLILSCLQAYSPRPPLNQEEQ